MKIKWMLVVLTLFSGSALAEIDPLKLKVRVTYPEKVKTVGQAAVYLLGATDYKFVTKRMVRTAPLDSDAIAGSPLSPSARTGEVMAIEEALVWAVGSKNNVVIDKEHKLVSFEKRTERD